VQSKLRTRKRDEKQEVKKETKQKKINSKKKLEIQ
jgi:hypothetical protein